MRGESDPKLCWSCGERGEPHIGSRMWCPDCEVTWMPWAALPPGAESLPAA